VSRNALIHCTFPLLGWRSGTPFAALLRMDEPAGRRHAPPWRFPLIGCRRCGAARFGSPLVLSRVHWVRHEVVADDNLLDQVVYEGLREDDH